MKKVNEENCSLHKYDNYQTECKCYYVAEEKDKLKTEALLKELKLLFEEKKITEYEFVNKYTTISDDEKSLELTDSDIPISFSIASMMKFGAEDLIERINDTFKRERHNEMIRFRVQPK